MKRAIYLLLILCFSFCLYPISYNGLSVNYIFILFPLLGLIFHGRIRKPPQIFLMMIFVYTSILLVASLYQYEFYGEFPRRLISFVLFMSMFSLIFIKIDEETITQFKYALIVISLYFSISSILTFVLLGGSSLGAEAKDVVGTQRFGFIYLMAFWLLLFDHKNLSIDRTLQLPAVFIVLLGLLLTFSRASLVSLLIGICCLILFNTISWIRKPNLSTLYRATWIVIFSILIIVVLNVYVPIIAQFFDERLFVFFTDREMLQGNLENDKGSEGIRIVIQQMIFEYVLNNPLTGSGYLGVWNISNGFTGSAHSQYTDALLRSGFFGFIIYLFLIIKILLHLFSKERGLFWGFLCVFFYGLFHETFKESQGGFLLAFFIGMIAQSPIQFKNSTPN